MIALITIGSILAYLAIGTVSAGYLAARADPDPGKPTEDARVAASLGLMFWPVIMACIYPFDLSMKVRTRLIERRERKRLPEARLLP